MPSLSALSLAAYPLQKVSITIELFTSREAINIASSMEATRMRTR